MYCRPVFFLLLVVLPLLALSAPTEDNQWEEYKAKYNKVYKDKAEDEKRRSIFRATLKKIAEHNDNLSRGLVSYSLGLNHLADKTEEELKMLRGAKMAPKEARNTVSLPQPENADRQIRPIVDLRSDPCMSPIKYQKDCGCCWAFASVHLMEFAYCKKNNLPSPVLLSEQNLVDCTYNRDGCNGGNVQDAYSHKSNIASSSAYPYVSGTTKTWNNGTCNFKASIAVTHVKSFRRLEDEASIEKALDSLAPVAVGIKVAGDNFNFYKSGIYSDLVACNPAVIGDQTDHDVTLVGYNNTNNPPYWILRNSWDTNWGLNGYMYMRKGINLCNVGKDGYGYVELV